MSRCRRLRLRTLACTLLVPAVAPAATVTWDAGGGSGLWGTAANWNPDTTLATGDFLLFDSSGTTALSNGTTANNTYGLTFNAAASAYTIGGNAITLDATHGITNDGTATQTFSTPFVLGANTTVAATSGGISLGGAVSGTGGLTKTGGSTLSFSGVNTYAGPTLVNGGLISVTAGSVTGSSSLLLRDGGALSLANATWTQGGSAGNFTVGYQSGAGTVTVGSGGTLNVGNGGARTFIGGGESGGPYGNGTLTVQTGGAVNIANTGAFPNDKVYLSGFGGAGTVNLDGGVLTTNREIQHGAGAGPSTVNFDGGTLRAGLATVNLLNSNLSRVNVRNNGAVIDTNGFDVTVPEPLLHSNIGGDNATDGGLVKNGAGVLTLSGTSTYNGPTTVNTGTLRLTTTNVAISQSAITVNPGAVVEFNSTSANDATPDWNYNRALSGGGTVNKTGTGWVYWPGTISLSGQINVTDGILSSGNGTSVWTGNTAGLSVASPGKFDLWGNNVTVGALTGNGTVANGSGASTYTLTVGANNASGSYSGTLVNTSGALALTKTGSGTQTLTGAGTYGGATRVSAGTLTLSSAGSLVLAGGLVVDGATAVANIQGAVSTSGTTSNPFDVKNGGVLNYSGTGTISNGGGGAMLVGSGSPGTLNMTGGTLTTTFSNTNGWGIGFQNNGDGTVNLTGGTLNASPANDVFLVGYGATNAKGVVAVSGTGVLNIGGGGGQTFIGGGAQSSGQYGTGTMTIGGGGVVNVAGPGTFPNDRLYLAGFGGSGTVNLNAGGTLATARGLGKGGTGALNLNGGTLRADATSTDFIRFNVTVQAGGAVFDTNGFDLTQNWPLLDGGGGGGLTKNGAGTLTLTTANGNSTFTGPIQVNAGALKASGGTGALPGSVTVASGASLDLNGVNFGALRDATVSGTGAAGLVGALVNTSASTEGFIRNLTLAGPATIGTSNAKLNVSGTLNGGGNTLTVAGTGQTNIRANNALTNLAGVQVNSGVFRIESSQAPASAFAITVNPGAILDTYDNRTQGANLGVVLNGGTLGSEGPTGTFTGTWNGPVSVTAASTANLNKDVVLNGALSGSAALAKNGAGTLTLANAASTFTGPISVNAGTLRVSSGTEQSLGANPGAPVANQLFLNGGTLRVDTASLTIDDSNRGVAVGLSGGTFLVDSSVSLTLGTGLSAGVGGSTFTKAGAGTFNLTANNTVNALVVSGGVIRQVSGTTSVLTTSTGLDIRNGGTYRLEGGVLRSDRIQVQTGAEFVWGAASLGQLSTNGNAGTTDYSGPGYHAVSTGVTASFQGSLASSAGSTLLMHGSPSLYLNSGVRFNNWAVTGDLDLSAVGDTLEFELNPYFLRPFSSAGIGAIETGSLPLITWGGAFLGGEFENVTGIIPTGVGFSEYAFSVSDPNDLDPNTWYIEYDTAAQTVWFHYKVTGYVPEPAGFTLLAGAVAGLRLMRRLGSLRGRVNGATSAR